MNVNAQPKQGATPQSGYIGISQLQFGPPNPNSIAIPIGIPKTNNGDTKLGMFSKLNKLMSSPLTKKVINTQQSRF
jgi:hypothetical protein